MKQILNQCICQYYKAVEKAIVIPTKGYKIEGNNKLGSTSHIFQRGDIIDYTAYGIDHKDHDAHWFRTYFLNSEDAYTFFGYTALDDEPVLISVKEEFGQLRLISRRKNGRDQRMLIEDSLYDMDWKIRIEAATSTILSRLVKLDQEQLISSGIQNDILKLDETSVIVKEFFAEDQNTNWINSCIQNISSVCY